MLAGGRRLRAALSTGLKFALSVVRLNCEFQFSNDEKSKSLNYAQFSLRTKVLGKCLGYNFHVWSFLKISRDLEIN